MLLFPVLVTSLATKRREAEVQRRRGTEVAGGGTCTAAAALRHAGDAGGDQAAGRGGGGGEVEVQRRRRAEVAGDRGWRAAGRVLSQSPTTSLLLPTVAHHLSLEWSRTRTAAMAGRRRRRGLAAARLPPPQSTSSSFAGRLFPMLHGAAQRRRVEASRRWARSRAEDMGGRRRRGSNLEEYQSDEPVPGEGKCCRSASRRRPAARAARRCNHRWGEATS